MKIYNKMIITKVVMIMFKYVMSPFLIMKLQLAEEKITKGYSHQQIFSLQKKRLQKAEKRKKKKNTHSLTLSILILKKNSFQLAYSSIGVGNRLGVFTDLHFRFVFLFPLLLSFSSWFAAWCLVFFFFFFLKRSLQLGFYSSFWLNFSLVAVLAKLVVLLNFGFFRFLQKAMESLEWSEWSQWTHLKS